MTKETGSQIERMEMWSLIGHDEIQSNPLFYAAGYLSAQNLGISTEQNDTHFRVYTTTLQGARAMNRIGNSYEITVLLKAYYSDSDSVPRCDLCDWDEMTVRRIQGWSLTRKVRAFEGYVQSKRKHVAFVEDLKDRGATHWGGDTIEIALRREYSELRNLIEMPDKLRKLCGQTLQELEPFNDKDIADLVKKIVDRELGVEEVQMRLLKGLE